MLGKKVVQLQKQLNLRSSQLLKPQSMVKPVANQMLCSTVEAQAHFCLLITLVTSRLPVHSIINHFSFTIYLLKHPQFDIACDIAWVLVCAV